MEFYGMSGERLGVIGRAETPPTEKATNDEDVIEDWKKEFMRKPSILRRHGFAWENEEPYENGFTQIFTSEKGDFLQIMHPHENCTSEPIFYHPNFWAVSGTVYTDFHPSSNEFAMPYTAHRLFSYEIDSRAQEKLGSHESDFFALPDDSFMEVGKMFNSLTGKIQMYKARWKKPLADTEGEGLPTFPCVVAKTVDDPSVPAGQVCTKGIIIRIGERCQCMLLAVGDDGKKVIFFEAWKRYTSHMEADLNVGRLRNPVDYWKKSWVNNTGHDQSSPGPIPTVWVVDYGRRKGDEFNNSGIIWRVTECWE